MDFLSAPVDFFVSLNSLSENLPVPSIFLESPNSLVFSCSLSFYECLRAFVLIVFALARGLRSISSLRCLERVPKNLLQKESDTPENFSPLYALHCCSFANHQDASSRAVFCLLTSFFLRTLLGRGKRTFVVPDLYNKDCV